LGHDTDRKAILDGSILISTLHISVTIKRSKNLGIAYCGLADVNNTPKMPYQISRKLPIVKNMFRLH